MADVDAGEPAADDDAGLLGVDMEGDAVAGFELLRSSCFFKGDPDGDLLAEATLDACDAELEYKLWFSMDAVAGRAL